MVNEGRLVIEILRATLEDKKLSYDMTSINFNKLFALMESHYITPFCYYSLKETENLPEDFKEKIRASYELALAKEASQELETIILLDDLEKAQIKHMPLKGFVIKNIYPKPYMRLSADVDILFDSTKKRKVKKILINRGYTLENQELNHDIYYKKPFVGMEMHRDLFSELVDMHGYFKKVWERVSLKEGKEYEYEFSHEDFYIFQMAHLYKHFSVSGSGIRSNLDTYIYLEKYGDKMDREYLNEEFEKLEILDFVTRYEELSYKWFTQGFIDDELGLFILSCGLFGNREHFILSKMINEEGKKNRLSYLFNRIFLPYRQMKSYYPILRKLPFLLPIMWLVRITKYIFRDKTDKGNEIKIAKTINSKKIEDMIKVKKKAGIKVKRDQ